MISNNGNDGNDDDDDDGNGKDCASMDDLMSYIGWSSEVRSHKMFESGLGCMSCRR